MMAGAREFASMLCVAAISCQALRLLTPRGTLEKPLQMLLSLFFLLCLLTPLRGDLDFEFSREVFSQQSQPYLSDLQEGYGALLEKAVQENIGRIIEARLQKMDAEGTNILVNVHAGEDGSIDISEIVVTLSESSAGMAGQVRERLEEEMELPVRVLTGSEVQNEWS